METEVELGTCGVGKDDSIWLVAGTSKVGGAGITEEGEEEEATIGGRELVNWVVGTGTGGGGGGGQAGRPIPQLMELVETNIRRLLGLEQGTATQLPLRPIIMAQWPRPGGSGSWK